MCRRRPRCAPAGPDVSRLSFPMMTSRWCCSTHSYGLGSLTGNTGSPTASTPAYMRTKHFSVVFKSEQLVFNKGDKDSQNWKMYILKFYKNLSLLCIKMRLKSNKCHCYQFVKECCFLTTHLFVAPYPLVMVRKVFSEYRKSLKGSFQKKLIGANWDAVNTLTECDSVYLMVEEP